MTDPTTLVAGETLVDFIPDRPGRIVDVEHFTPRPGGAPANVAVTMTRLGATPWFLSRVARDDFGEHLADRLSSEGVPGRFVQRDPDRRTTLAFVTHDADAERAFTFYRENAADAHITASTVPAGTLDAVDTVCVGGVLLTTEPARTELFDLVDRATDHDCTVVFDPNTRPELWADETESLDVLESMLDRVDVVKTSADDFARFDYPTDPDALATALLERGPHTVLLTRGSAGATLHATADAPWGEGTWSHAGYPVDPVDTTGAGDAFLGGFLAALDETTAPGELLGFANAVAALATTEPGAWAGLPHRESVDAFRTEP